MLLLPLLKKVSLQRKSKEVLQVLVGLGNPGDRYKNTKHNFGFLLLDQLGVPFKGDKKFRAEIGTLQLNGAEIVCLKPQTFMNNSGQSVADYLNFYQIEAKSCLIVHDELDLKFGDVRLKFGRGEGGHNGLKSISSCLGTQEYPRLRLGIGKPDPGSPIAMEDWVLMRFASADAERLPEIYERGNAALRSIMEFGFQKAQSLINRKADETTAN